MASIDNLANKLCALALADKNDCEVKEWRLLGQEQNGTLLFTWIEINPNANIITKSHIGLYNYIGNILDIIHTFDTKINIIQASVNSSKTILAYVRKELTEDNINPTYAPFLLNLTNKEIINLNIDRPKQIMLQFRHKKQTVLNEQQDENLLLLIHEECITQYQLKNKHKDSFTLDSFLLESLVKVFMWAQWDAVKQILYYIHYRKPIKSLVEDETEMVSSAPFKVTPTLSGLQFHDDLPHETVLNIPLNLPHLSTLSADCAVYEDDTVPLRIHNCSLDLIVLTTKNGAVFICHHYLYQPVNPPAKLEEHDVAPVHFAYSITALHQSCILHCVVPGIPWNLARTIRPLFTIYDEHLLVFIPTICAHLLDLGMIHEPCNHVTTTADLPSELDNAPVSLTPIISDRFDVYVTLNTVTLDLVNVRITNAQLMRTFNSAEATIANKIAILHYLLLHLGELELVTELLIEEVKRPFRFGLPQLLKEFLIVTSYATVRRSMPSDASELINLLPITMQPVGCETETKIGDKTITLSQDALWNATMMLLSPQQRIVPFRVDIWVKLWDHLIQNARGKIRFKPSQVVDKLMISLVCYQPEALSRSSTPMSPVGSLSVATAADISLLKSQMDSLPFSEYDSCTASKQEHIISVNLRELSMHLLKQSTASRLNRYQWQSQTPLHVHAVATRYITAQLEQSRFLCQIMCKAAVDGASYAGDKGFAFIDQLSEDKQFLLFTTLERYFLAVESIAYPFPLGFTSFFTFLGYRTLTHVMFLQYVTRKVFELHVDVMKLIMTDIDDTDDGVAKKLNLLSKLPRSRANRLLNQWNHPISYMLRAREHAANILSGLGGGGNTRGQPIHKTRHQKLDFKVYALEGRVSPLDTFFDLLTAKASLSDLDFGLLIEAMNDKN